MGRKKKMYMFRGELHTVDYIANELDMTVAGVHCRIHNGIPLDMEKKPKLKFHGQEISWREIEDLTGIKRGTLWKRMQRRGMTLEEAVQMGVQQTGPESREEMILLIWGRGRASIEDVIAETGFSRKQIDRVLPIEAIEMQEKKEVLEKYGYKCAVG